MVAAEPLDGPTLEFAARELSRSDPVLARLLAAHGAPPMWGREPGFATLAWIVLGQQVSLASATAAFERLRGACGGRVTPVSVLRLELAGLRGCGLTRQKAGYVIELASAVDTRRLDLEAVGAMADDDVRERLVEQRGIGPWSADIYLLMALRRPDVWPTADLALVEAVREAAGWPDRPTSEVVAAHATRWLPWRSVAARMLWQAYLITRGRPLD
jgi:DNA-3-methyladenine glycosylase II